VEALLADDGEDAHRRRMTAPCRWKRPRLRIKAIGTVERNTLCIGRDDDVIGAFSGLSFGLFATSFGLVEALGLDFRGRTSMSLSLSCASGGRLRRYWLRSSKRPS